MTANRAASIRARLKQHPEKSKQDFSLTLTQTAWRLQPGPWQGLLVHASHLIDEIRAHGIDDPYWTFGSGTVLMLRYRHRRSKDIDIFVPDPQYLGYVSPRLSEVAEAITADCVEGASFVKPIRPEGEIDFVASPDLTATPFEMTLLDAHATWP
jgi:hypothetical protein